MHYFGVKTLSEKFFPAFNEKGLRGPTARRCRDASGVCVAQGRVEQAGQGFGVWGVVSTGSTGGGVRLSR